MTIDQLFIAAMNESRAGRIARAQTIYRQILSADPKNPKAHYNLANLLRREGRIADAVAAYEQAIKYQPSFPEAINNLALLLQHQGQLDRAIALFRQAIAIHPDSAQAHQHLARAFHAARQFEQAITAAEHAIALQPDLAAAYSILGEALLATGRRDDAITALRRAVSLNADQPDALSSLGVALCDVGRCGEGLAFRRRASDLRPDDPAAHSAWLFTMLQVEAKSPSAILAEHCKWNDRHAAKFAGEIRPHDNNREPTRRLRIGYVSADLCRHVVGWNLLPLLANHDRAQFEIFCYASNPHSDDFTARLRSHADAWRDIAALSDAQAAETIRADKIDILLDLGLHTIRNRLLVFARKPAPVQATFMGYPGTTGVAAIDYRLTDPYLDPPGNHDDEYSEKSIRLPHSFWCYDPTADALPPDLVPNPAPASALTNGYVTFGCQNNILKLTDATLALWSKVLTAVPNSRFLSLAPPNSARQRIVDAFTAAGIAADRIDFVAGQPRPQHLAGYHRIDVGLDTIPYNGHTSSLDAYWMGVPIITRPGPTVVSRAGFSQLSNLDLQNLAATSDEDFVRIAVDLAADLPNLANLRATLRQRLEQSPLMNGPQFARDVESAYRQMWRRWTE